MMQEGKRVLKSKIIRQRRRIVADYRQVPITLTWLVLEASNESEEVFCTYATTTVQWRVHRHYVPIKCRVCASLLFCSRMRYAGALSAGIITNCWSSFDRSVYEYSCLRDRRIISKNNRRNHILLNEIKWFIWRNKIDSEKEERARERSKRQS